MKQLIVLAIIMLIGLSMITTAFVIEDLNKDIKALKTENEGLISIIDKSLSELTNFDLEEPIPIVITTFNANLSQCNNSLTTASGIDISDSTIGICGASTNLLFFHLNFHDKIYVEVEGNKKLSGWYEVLTTGAPKSYNHIDILISTKIKGGKWKGKITKIQYG